MSNRLDELARQFLRISAASFVTLLGGIFVHFVLDDNPGGYLGMLLASNLYAFWKD